MTTTKAYFFLSLFLPTHKDHLYLVLSVPGSVNKLCSAKRGGKPWCKVSKYGLQFKGVAKRREGVKNLSKLCSIIYGCP
jgi:hypothetical protein